MKSGRDSSCDVEKMVDLSGWRIEVGRGGVTNEMEGGEGGEGGQWAIFFS